MADFIVQEDGTSRIELEDGSGDLLTEESSPQERSASFGATASIFAASAPPPPSRATWKVGVINTPGSTGTVAYTGLEGQPKALFCWGTNFAAEDTIVTAADSAIFRGMATEQHDAPGTIVQNVSALTVDRVEHFTLPSVIYTPSPGFATDLYRANLDSFDADGFTLDWTVANSGYKVVYAALMEVANAGGFEFVGGFASEDLGWKAGALLLQGAWGGPSISGGTRNQEYFGGAAYPGTNAADWMGAGLTSYVLPTAPGAQYNIGIFRDNPNTVIAQDGNFIGPFLDTQNLTAVPSGTGLTVLDVSTHVSITPDQSVIVTAWDDEASATGRLTPDATSPNTVTVSGLSFAPGLVTGYSISNEPPGQGSAAIYGAVGFSLVAPGFQWTALIDRTPSASAFQSFQRGVVDTVTPSTVHTGTIELTNDGFVVTTEEDNASPSSWVWHAFGHPEQTVMWIPQIYRRQT